MTWLDDVIVAYGEPRLHGGPVELCDDENGRFMRTYWVWFPRNRNHHISIDRRSGAGRVLWEIRIGAHVSTMADVEYRTFREPDDELMRKLIALIDFCSTPTEPVAVAAVASEGTLQ